MIPSPSVRRFLLAGMAVVFCGRLAAAQQPYDVAAHYDKTQHMVPMRDGTRLHTTIYAPKETAGVYPIMLFRTPYGTGPYGPDEYPASLGPSQDFARDGFIFVYQDVRGKLRSEGEFIVMKPYIPEKHSPSDVDESSDTYDTIDWLLNHLPNDNGRVGQWGVSYPGWQTAMGMIDAHPALVASSPQASPSDMFIGDDFHHNGAFRLMYTFNWLAGNARARGGPSSSRSGRFDYPTPDGYTFFLEAGTLNEINNRFFQGTVPTWDEYMRHGSYDDYWKARDFLPHMAGVNHAILNVAGWFDAEDFYGPMSIYYAIERQNAANKSTLVVGPWLHGGWSRGKGNTLGDIPFGSNTSEDYRTEIEFPFFRDHLKENEATELPEAYVFETGRNHWRSFDHWPPRETQHRNLYFREAGGLSFEPPADDLTGSPCDTYVSDPTKPVPFSSEIVPVQGHRWMVEDQRFAARRPDVLVYQTPPLEEDVTVAGPIIASLRAATTGTDCDFVVKLIDVYPSDNASLDPYPFAMRRRGYQMLVAGEVMRAKFRESFEKPEPMVPNEITTVEFDLRDKFHTFLKGHRIMVQIQSSWFPVIDRNPQKFVDIYTATASDFQTATQKVYRSREDASHVKLNVLTTALADGENQP